MQACIAPGSQRYKDLDQILYDGSAHLDIERSRLSSFHPLMAEACERVQYGITVSEISGKEHLQSALCPLYCGKSVSTLG